VGRLALAHLDAVDRLRGVVDDDGGARFAFVVQSCPRPREQYSETSGCGRLRRYR
jgi:hypothetical protein